MIGFSCVALGGVGPFISSFNIANITDSQTTVTSIIASLFNLAGLAYFGSINLLDLVNVDIDNQRNLTGLLFFYFGVGNFVIAYLIWPVRTYAPNTYVESLLDFHLTKRSLKSTSHHRISNFVLRRNDDDYIPLIEESA